MKRENFSLSISAQNFRVGLPQLRQLSLRVICGQISEFSNQLTWFRIFVRSAVQIFWSGLRGLDFQFETNFPRTTDWTSKILPINKPRTKKNRIVGYKNNESFRESSEKNSDRIFWSSIEDDVTRRHSKLIVALCRIRLSPKIISKLLPYEPPLTSYKVFIDPMKVVLILLQQIIPRWFYDHYGWQRQ